MVDLKDFKGHYRQLNISEHTPVIELNAVHKLSILRDDQQVSGNGEIIDNPSYYRVRHPGGGDFASLRSGERGRYLPGRSALIGIGSAFSTMDLTGNNHMEEGYFDMQLDGSNNNTENVNNGALVGVDSTDLYFRIVKGGTEIMSKVYQADWNLIYGNPEFDMTRGHMFQISHNYYGFGLTVLQKVIAESGMERQTVLPLHSFKPEGETLFTNSNLQVGALVYGDDAQDLHIDVGGRQFMIDGKYDIRNRFPSTTFQGVTVDNADPFDIVGSIRRKPTRREISMNFYDLAVSATEKTLIRVYVGNSLTDSTYSESFEGIPDDETGLEIDIAATAFSGGVKVAEEVVPGGDKNKTEGNASVGLPGSIPDERNVTIVAKSLTGNSSDLTVRAKFKEEF